MGSLFKSPYIRTETLIVHYFLLFHLHPLFAHRYVTCARNKDESNLLAVEYNSIVLFHCSRTINPGDELLVWPSSKLLAHFTDIWSQVWFSRANGTGTFVCFLILYLHLFEHY